MKGKIISWKDDKGFGFITPDGQNERVFFHISIVKTATRKPAVGDAVVFEVARDSQGRLKATHVLLEDISLANPGIPKRIVTEPVKNDALDYVAYFTLAVLFALSLGTFVKTGSPESALVPGAIFLIVLFVRSNRKKQPANKLFSCSKCRSISSHNERTVLAWNSGFNKLYCNSCHQAWLRQQPKEDPESRDSYASSRSGCLGLFLFIASFPIIFAVGAITWFV
jgi:cold shock CspA family protein